MHVMKQKKTTAASRRQRTIACAQLAQKHPILRETPLMKQNYFDLLCACCGYGNVRLNKPSLNSNAVIEYNMKAFVLSKVYSRYSSCNMPKHLRIVLLFDILHASGYARDFDAASAIRRLHLHGGIAGILHGLLLDLRADNPLWEKLMINPDLVCYRDWIEQVRVNANFSRTKPYTIMVTATMSAGKSTFINALAGKKIANTKNMACTGRLHYIYSKPFDDGIISKWEPNKHVLLDAGTHVLDEKEEIREEASYESTYFRGGLAGVHCMLLDTPGVNAATYEGHGECTQDAIRNVPYDALICLLNYEQIGTEDAHAHLNFIRKNVDTNIPVIFGVNKIDERNNDDLPLDRKMRDLAIYLRDEGFPDALLFLVSAKSAYLYRVQDMLVDEDEIEELTRYVKRVNRKENENVACIYRAIKLPYIKGTKDSVNNFEYQSGIRYIEDYLKRLIAENERNGLQ